MGLLSSIGNAAKNFLTTNTVGKAITKTLDTISGVVTNPITAITQGTAASTAKYNATPTVSNIVKTVTNVGLAAGAVVGGGAIAAGGTATIGKAVQAVIPSTTKGKVIAAVVAPVAVGAVIKEPAKTTESILNAPAALANFGGNVAGLVADPSLSKAKEVIKENPAISAAVLGGAALAVGSAVTGTIATIANTKAVKENTAIMNNPSPSTNEGSILVVDKSGQFKSDDKINTGTMAPITPQTQTVSANTSSSNKKRRRKQTKMPNINQKVNVIVSNKSSSVGIKATRKFINREILA